MLYSQQIKNLVAGISQQPPILRLPEQLTQQINGFSTEAGGLQKRPPTVFLSNIFTPLQEGHSPLMHFINRDEHERYIMYFFANTLRIFTLDGSMKDFQILEDSSYLQTSNPRSDLRVITIADHTFILNRRVKVKLKADKSFDYFHTQGALVHVKQGQYGRTYKIWVNGKLVATHETPDGSDKSHTKQIDTNVIATALAEEVRKAGFTVDVGNTWLRIQGASSVQTQDGFNNQALIGTVGHIQKFSLLPETAPPKYCVKVAGDPKGGNEGSYYVQYDANENIWKECVAPNIPLALDESTMPHILRRDGDGSFSFRRAQWAMRKVGDEDSNPLPSFIGQTLNDIFFYRNRLGFLSGENIILSESAEYFNFWMTTANDILDTDCIDVPTTTTRINILNYAVPFNQSLYCFSDSTQFMLSSDTVLSPKNCALVEVTGFNASPHCRPIAVGKNLYFPAERVEHTSVKEYYNVQDIADIKNAQDITSHVGSYIPNGVYQIVANTNENLMLFLTEGDKQSIYVYKYLFLNEQRVQAAWSKWTFGGDIFGAFFIASTLYILLNRGDKHVLEKMDFTQLTKDVPNQEPYRVHLDSKGIVVPNMASFDKTTDTVQVDVRNLYRRDMNTDIAYVLPDGKFRIIPKNELIGKSVFHIPAVYANKPVVVGIPYTFQAQLSPIYIRQEDSKGGVKSITNGRLQIRSIEMNYSDTGEFTAHVRSRGHTYEYTMTNKKIGTMRFGSVPLLTGVFRIPIQAENTAYECTLASDSPFPLALLGYVWKGSFVPRSKGV